MIEQTNSTWPKFRRTPVRCIQGARGPKRRMPPWATLSLCRSRQRFSARPGEEGDVMQVRGRAAKGQSAAAVRSASRFDRPRNAAVLTSTISLELGLAPVFRGPCRESCAHTNSHEEHFACGRRCCACATTWKVNKSRA